MKIDRNELLARGIFVEKMTHQAALVALARALRPVATQYPLIRVGGANDGGYLLPDDFQGIDVCFSPGVGDLADFESDLLKRSGILSHLTDGSVAAAPQTLRAKSFMQKFLGAHDSERHITLDSWMKGVEDLSTGQDYILQMDIEGGEYASILATPEEQLKRFRLMVIEIHDVEAWGCPTLFKLVRQFFAKILKNFVVVHNHPNNCCGLVNLGGFIAPQVFELTFHRKDRVTPSGYASTFPHPLDRANLSTREDLVLPRNWWGD
jgi:hypothetical protein